MTELTKLREEVEFGLFTYMHCASRNIITNEKNSTSFLTTENRLPQTEPEIMVGYFPTYWQNKIIK